MKTEGNFNSHLSKQFKKLAPDVHYLKASDRFAVGVSDFLVFGKGKTLAIESKFVNTVPGDNVRLLNHEFTGPQLTFLESMELAGCRALGLVGIKEFGRMYLIERRFLKNNWKVREFLELLPEFAEYEFKEVPKMLWDLWG